MLLELTGIEKTFAARPSRRCAASILPLTEGK